MLESIKDFLTDVYESYSDIKPWLKVGQAAVISINIAETLTEVNELLPYTDCSEVPDYALTKLDSLNLPEKPKYGMEIATAAVYLYMGYFYLGKKDYTSARHCSEVVERIPNRFGNASLREIKEFALRLKNTLPCHLEE